MQFSPTSHVDNMKPLFDMSINSNMAKAPCYNEPPEGPAYTVGAFL